MSPVARFVVIDGPDTGQQFLVSSGRATLGRSPQCEIVLSDELASRQHATVSWKNGAWMIEDLGSRNGTFANEQPIQPRMPHALFSGDQVRLANTVLNFEEIYEAPDGVPEAGLMPSQPSSGVGETGLHGLTYALIAVAVLLLLALLVLVVLTLVPAS